MAVTLIPSWLLDKELRGRPGAEQSDLQRFCERATGIVLDYLEATDKIASPAEWDEETVPEHVKAAILQVAVNLYAHRGDDDGDIDGPITTRVRNILMRTRPLPVA